jgi:hypothetical protein
MWHTFAPKAAEGYRSDVIRGEKGLTAGVSLKGKKTSDTASKAKNQKSISIYNITALW